MGKRLDQELLAETDRVSSDVVHHVARLLEAGADPNAVQRKVNDFRSALGNLIYRGQDRAVREMLASGACVHWPERSIPQAQLAGAEDNAYQGLALDALSLCMEQLGWTLAERATLGKSSAKTETEEEDGGGFSDLLEEYMNILPMLLRAGANPAWEDPATSRLPSEALVRAVEEGAFGITTEFPVDLQQRFAAIVEQTLSVLDPATQSQAFRALASRDWALLPHGWGHLEGVPQITGALVARADARILDEATPAPQSRRQGVRL